MDLKSILGSGVACAALFSFATAEQISIPHEFSAGSPARAADVNENFDTLVKESNAQDERIVAVEAGLAAAENAEQMYCTYDPRDSRAVISSRGFRATSFPVPRLFIRLSETLVAITYAPAICASPTMPDQLIETDARELASDGWLLKGDIAESNPVLYGPNASRGAWYLFER